MADIGERGYADLYDRGARLTDGLREILTDAGHDVFVPEFAGFSFVHFADGESDPSGWHDWRAIAPRTDEETYERFTGAMIGEGIFRPPKQGRINLMHAHTDAHIEEALEAAKTAIAQV